jgi:hypothetical protein
VHLMNNWTSFHLEHFQAHCKNSVSLSIEIRLALKDPWYRVSLLVPFHLPYVKIGEVTGSTVLYMIPDQLPVPSL